ncbi:hypothetical protein G6011_05283 [Alternaria panax]|uniref:Xylanolytic transcriptional activator regulatory domain-containing protein n=1 Tax=Alternaria panax TaxID=48097 RepID=A0AAD4FCS0_9PLEO|nr:hypothetical protein G6011_05283 [Alternaria panax]
MEHGHDRYSPSDAPAEEYRPSKRRRTSGRPAREVGLMRSVPGDKYHGFVGSASGIFFIRSVYGAIRASAVAAVAETPRSDIVPGEDDHLPLVQPNSFERLWRDAEIVSDQTSRVSFRDLVAFSGSYFANWHPFYPFVHASTVLEYFDCYAKNGFPHRDDSEDLEMVITRSIMSISLADHRQSPGIEGVRYPACIVFSSYDAAVDSLRAILSRPTTILTLQAALSVQLFLVSMLRLNAASRIGGLIMRMAVQLGLHRCPARFPAFTSSARELRQRVFWSLYAIDRFISQSMGLPLGLQDDDLDVCFPLAEHHPQTHLEPYVKLRLLHLLAQQARLRGEIIELRNKSLHYVQNDPNRDTSIIAKLSQWWNDVEDYVDPDSQYAVSPYATVILTLLRHESIISLYRPVLATSRKDVAYDAALQQCINSARSIITTLHSAIQTKPKTGMIPDQLALLWPSCTWAIWISTFIMFYAAHESRIACSVVVRFADKSLDILQHLAQRGSAWPEASSAAIRDLRTRMLYTPNQVLVSHKIDVSGDFPIAEQGKSSLHSDLHEPISTASNDVLDRDGNQMANGMASHHGQWYNSHSAALDLTATSNPTMGTTGLGENDSYWDVFLGAEGADASSLEYSSGLDPFSGFDIPFWFDQDQHWDFS